jgi:hypothetical protein
MNSPDYLTLLRQANERENTPDRNCINRVKDFTQFVQLPTGAISDESSLAERVGAGGTESTWWLIHYADRTLLEVSYTPPATHAEVLTWHPVALAAEPFEPVPRLPGSPMTPSEEREIRAWHARVGTDDADVAVTLRVCRDDADARDYYLRRARHG